MFHVVPYVQRCRAADKQLDVLGYVRMSAGAQGLAGTRSVFFFLESITVRLGLHGRLVRDCTTNARGAILLPVRYVRGRSVALVTISVYESWSTENVRDRTCGEGLWGESHVKLLMEMETILSPVGPG